MGLFYAVTLLQIKQSTYIKLVTFFLFSCTYIFFLLFAAGFIAMIVLNEDVSGFTIENIPSFATSLGISSLFLFVIYAMRFFQGTLFTEKKHGSRLKDIFVPHVRIIILLCTLMIAYMPLAFLIYFSDHLPAAPVIFGFTMLLFGLKILMDILTVLVIDLRKGKEVIQYILSSIK